MGNRGRTVWCNHSGNPGDMDRKWNHSFLNGEFIGQNYHNAFSPSHFNVCCFQVFTITKVVLDMHTTLYILYYSLRTNCQK